MGERLLVVLETIGAVIQAWGPFLALTAGAGLTFRFFAGRRVKFELGGGTADPSGFCDCPAGVDDPHKPQEHSSCGGRLCGQCDTCVSASRSGRRFDL